MVMDVKPYVRCARPTNNCLAYLCVLEMHMHFDVYVCACVRGSVHACVCVCVCNVVCACSRVSNFLT